MSDLASKMIVETLKILENNVKNLLIKMKQRPHIEKIERRIKK